MTSTASAQSPIADCKRALNLYKDAVDLQNAVIEKQNEQIELLKMDRADLTQILEERQAWYKQSEIVGPLVFVIGVGLGAYVTRGK
jgi:hypothetical protein